jgi:DNA/RNA-binding domain of Phe-tRNA-synthetase-like protein
MTVLDVEPVILEAGLSTAALVARNVDNTHIKPDLIAYRRQVAGQLADYWKNRSAQAHPVIEEYHRVHHQFGQLQEPPAPQKLINNLRRNRDLTSSSALVDCYNLVSAKTLLSIGAHDLDKLALPITLRIAGPGDRFVPLGETEPREVTGEFAYIDANRSIICRADVLQCEGSKTTRDSRDVVFFFQGNKLLPATVMLKGIWLLSEMVTRFCGGATEVVSFFAAQSLVHEVPLKPTVSFETFTQLQLQKGRVVSVRRLAKLPAFSAITVQTTSRMEALVLTSALPGHLSGDEGILVVTDLHPLTVAGETFTSFVPILRNRAGVGPFKVEAAIEDGARLF